MFLGGMTTSICPAWHGWMHYTYDDPPKVSSSYSVKSVLNNRKTTSSTHTGAQNECQNSLVIIQMRTKLKVTCSVRTDRSSPRRKGNAHTLDGSHLLVPKQDRARRYSGLNQRTTVQLWQNRSDLTKTLHCTICCPYLSQSH